MKFRMYIALAASIALFTGSVPAVAAEEAVTETSAVAAPAVSVTGGTISGTASSDGEVNIFKGIPYAKPPVGDLRWAYPQDVEPWDDVKECVEFGSSAMQGDENVFGNFTDEYLNSNREHSEDCLTLNVWAPAEDTGTPKPVLFYIHGGGFSSGGSSCPIYDGELMAKKGIVYVSINYRLGQFGFFANSELAAEDEDGNAGNYAIADMIKALEWVQDNIAAFGGDPSNVTIAGQSAGASAVNTLSISPEASGLFKQIIGWSGLSISASGTTLEEAVAVGDSAEEALELDLAGLRALPAEEIMALNVTSRPIVDKKYMPKTSLQTMLDGEENDGATMTGLVRGDATMGGVLQSSFSKYLGLGEEEYKNLVAGAFGDLAEDFLAVYPPNGSNSLGVANQVNLDYAIARYQIYARVRALTAQTPTYLYFYDHDYAELAEQGAFHTSDIPYWLGGVFTEEKEFSENDQRIADMLSAYLTNFVQSGDVNGEGLEEWTPYDGTPGYFAIDNDSVEFVKINPIRANVWDAYYSKLLGIDPAPVEVTEADEAALAEEIEAMHASADAMADDLIPITDDDPENPTLKIDLNDDRTAMVYEMAGSGWQIVSSSGMYPLRAFVYDAEGNVLGNPDIVDSFCDFSEYPDAVQFGILSSFTGRQLIVDLAS